MALNITSQIPELAGLTNSCYEWCVEQHYVHAFINFQLLTSASSLLLFSILVFYFAVRNRSGRMYLVGSLLLVISFVEILAFIYLETRT